ncbi:glycosyltransferase [Archaeoglobus profundus]|uniref:Glycosyltransferase probably involved in cell wall biogenesis-like protein n=1 Tax=Archaeoglobus profundus (strain DSM 5631 / JCM 9629 / NBRC 100127 / Av18) TaxID=572546 RepID=D2RFK2_ARCPA|nr:glycosyltransferase family 2 protein [Archaeoglobus profundus]ADB58896.1 Glycosyltransferase probably involved in cell wall biogenesis-like protein [Archaeoglobus profundus DSM 5631]
MRIAILIPVSPFEPLETVSKSVERLKKLDLKGFEVKIVYVVDKKNPNDERVDFLKKAGVDVLVRNSNRGKRAGAINDGIEFLKDFNPKYLVIFDVDSNPSVDFVKNCVYALENDEKAYLASTRRYVYNPINLPSKTVWLEYHLINFLLKRTKFKQFNGLIGVVRFDLISKYRLNEEAVAEDADFATRMHCLGYRALLVEGKLFEQAPMSWKDIFNQRCRWYYGGLQLWRYFKDVLKTKNWGFITSWISSLTLTYVVSLFLPLLPLGLPYMIHKIGFKEASKGFVGLLIHVTVLQTASIYSIVKFLIGKRVEWKPVERFEQIS